ncbi:hypothetical protein HPB51_025023 [Rhipicephalus microplus]|uniref:Uncharacterized protein n=1 Tax=Rhipicephalus microplus TaxID=6941 RepID=A0A9J6DXA3_RHIMP|nr:hypothetical protein HPB51_025023 [Rhipicephalus microplus]
MVVTNRERRGRALHRLTALVHGVNWRPMLLADELMAYCWNEPYGCNFVGPIAVVLEHYEQSCAFHVFLCQRCGEIMKNDILAAHYVSRCKHRLSSASLPEVPGRVDDVAVSGGVNRPECNDSARSSCGLNLLLTAAALVDDAPSSSECDGLPACSTKGRTKGPKGDLPQEALTTAWFIETIYRWFKVLASRTTRLGISKLNDQKYEDSLIFLKDMVTLFTDLKIGSPSKHVWKPVQTGITLVCKIALELQHYYLNEKVFFFVLLSRFGQDALEHLFSTLRAKNAVP